MDHRDVIRKTMHIRRVRHDAETAHGMEDVLHQTVLNHIAAGSTECPQLLARAALRTQRIRFPRWCA